MGLCFPEIADGCLEFSFQYIGHKLVVICPRLTCLFHFPMHLHDYVPRARPTGGLLPEGPSVKGAVGMAHTNVLRYVDCHGCA